ncbi:YhcH/YjgK/YiaL family protein [uncultured Mitsuokella sp.]|uniref:YhcH/YjgK/YiaL family protein n=1 Tax=uncultured Mitsuokella sp. TaxID=453120 RepID=UPI0025CF6E3C|nr:YhcH/YjgK/YiaL family protein [uncultured Mitsuokella sp.]
MFVGKMDTLAKDAENLAEAIKTSLAYLNSHDFTKMADGSYEVADGITANLQRYTTRPVTECRPERHERFADIQYVVEGEEDLGWCPESPELKVAIPYDAAKDILFYEKLAPESHIVLRPGFFAVLYPEDVHQPQAAVAAPAPVTKVVVKIAMDCL